MTPKYQENLYKTLKLQYEDEIKRCLLKLNELFDKPFNPTDPSPPTYPTDVLIKKLSDTRQRLITLEEYINGSKPLKQLLND